MSWFYSHLSETMISYPPRILVFNGKTNRKNSKYYYITSLPRFRSRLAYQNVPKNTDLTLSKTKTLTLLPKTSKNKIMNSTFSPALLILANPPRHPNQIPIPPSPPTYFPIILITELYCLYLGKVLQIQRLFFISTTLSCVNSCVCNLPFFLQSQTTIRFQTQI